MQHRNAPLTPNGRHRLVAPPKRTASRSRRSGATWAACGIGPRAPGTAPPGYPRRRHGGSAGAASGRAGVPAA